VNERPGQVRQQLSRLNVLWGLRPPQIVGVPRRPVVPCIDSTGLEDVAEWELTLGSLAIDHHPPAGSTAHSSLRTDNGIGVLRTLIGEFRDGRITRTMRFTLTLLLASLGPAAVQELLRDYHASAFPDLFASGEADRFAEYLQSQLARLPPVPFLPARARPDSRLSLW
jgi:hypothetical protein